MPAVDFSRLRHEIKAAARRAFTQVRAAHPGEHFYAYALYSDDGAMTVMPAANTEEAHVRRATEDDFGFVPGWLRWATAEWAYEAVGEEHFQDAYEILNADDRYDESAKGAFEALRKTLYATMTQALGDLDAEGFFGTGAAREAVTLFCSISDSEDAEKLEVASARQLNSPAVAARFEAERDADAE